MTTPSKVISFKMAQLRKEQKKRIFLATGTQRRVTLEQYVELLRARTAVR
jgi:hypothetical protein